MLGVLIKEPVGVRGRAGALREEPSFTSHSAAPLLLREIVGGGRQRALFSLFRLCYKALKNIWSLQIWKEKLLHKNTNWKTYFFTSPWKWVSPTIYIMSTTCIMSLNWAKLKPDIYFSLMTPSRYVLTLLSSSSVSQKIHVQIREQPQTHAL